MKIALVTGASRGLGRSAALALAQRGVDVILTYNSKKKEAEEVVAEIKKLGRKAVALQLDVSKSSTFTGFAKSIQEVLLTHWSAKNFDYLVNNAGIGINASFAETTEEQFDELMNIHLKGPFFLTQKLLPLMNDGGRIINFSSGLARFALPGYAAYGAMKGAIEVLTRYMAKELGTRGITVNVIAPGPIATDFGNGKVRDDKNINNFLASQTPLGRVGVAEDIGPLVAHLLSDETRWMTAQRIEASGGIFI
ncbi:SDR family oxidoreductase [Bdellovibrio sp. BCCA]|uniref:SDR family NAD(P)-dependent oxidoreductase n=1 Tax=Bdellovibrio sp. BCCA TaxID=3136281 RepID=UPI0030F1B61C